MNEINIYRNYPQLVHAWKELVAAFEQGLCVSANLTSPENAYQTLSCSKWNEIKDMLTSFHNWDDVSDLFLTVDYHSKNDIWRTRHDKEITLRHFNKNSQKRFDFDYGLSKMNCYCSLDVQFHSPDLEEEEEQTFLFDEVTIATRQQFAIVSKNVPLLKFQFELSSNWNGESFQVAEKKMKDGCAPRYEFCCAVIHSDQLVKKEDISTMFLSLLLKMQDFLDLPFYQSNHSQKMAPIPFFAKKTKI